MPPTSHRPTAEAPQGSVVAMLAERPQVDFELAFYGAILGRVPDYADVLQAHSGNLTAKGLVKEGLTVDRALVELRPDDPDVRYNLACRYALLRQPDLAVATLRAAIELGYRDFRYMIRDRDLESVRKDPRFRALLREFAG